MNMTDRRVHIDIHLSNRMAGSKEAVRCASLGYYVGPSESGYEAELLAEAYGSNKSQQMKSRYSPGLSWGNEWRRAPVRLCLVKRGETGRFSLGYGGD